MSGDVDAYGNPETVAVDDLIRSAWGNAAWERIILTFPSATERDATITAPIEGMMCRLTTDNKWTRYNGAKWIDDYSLRGLPGEGSWGADINRYGGGTAYSDQTWTEPGGPATALLPFITVTTEASALVIIQCQMASMDEAQVAGFLSYSISGATTVAASDGHCVGFESDPVNTLVPGPTLVDFRTGLTPGSNTFQMEQRAGNATVESRFVRPRIMAIPMIT